MCECVMWLMATSGTCVYVGYVRRADVGVYVGGCPWGWARGIYYNAFDIALVLVLHVFF